jgi:hypothetical protein
LLGDRLARVLDNVEKHHAANECPAISICDHRGLTDVWTMDNGMPVVLCRIHLGTLPHRRR